MSKSSKLKKHLAALTAALALTLPATGYAGPSPTPPPTPPPTPTPTVDTGTITYNIGVSTGLFNSLNSAMNILNWAQPLNFLGWSNNPSVPVSNQGAVSQSLGGNGGTSTGLVSTGGGSYDPLSSLKSINDHVVVVETSTKPKRASTGNVKVDQAKTEQTEAAKKLLETAKSGDKDEMKKATEELQKKNDELQKVREQEQNNKANQEALEKSLKDAQEAAKKVEEARAKAELAARDYLNALKTGDPEIIAAYKERLQEANDAYLAARQNEEAQIKNASNPYTIGGVYNNLTGTPEPGQQGGEQQDNSAESGGFPSLSELVRQYQEQQQQQSGETTIVTVGEPQESDALKRINDLIGKELIERETNARNKLVKAKTSEERQQAMKELDEIHRLETEKVQAQREEAASNAQEALLNAQAEKEQQQSQIQQDEEKPSAPPLSELIQQFGTEQQKQALQQQQQEQQQQGGGTVITTAGEQKDSGSKINDLIGTELLEKETNARNKLVKAKTSEEKAEAMKELDEVHKEETEKVNKLLKEQEEKQRIEVMEQQLEAQRRQEEQLKVVGGPEGGEALTRGAKRASDALKKTKDLEKRIDELKKEYDETDKAARKLTDQYYKAKEAGASKEELEKIAKEWNELDQKRSELDKQRDNALVEHMNASDEAAKEAAEYSRLQGIAKEAQQELDKLGLDKAKDDLAAKQAEYDRVSGRDIENGRDSAAEAAMKAVDDKYAAELQSLHQQYDEAINNGTSEDIERASSLLENKNMEVGMEKSEAANKAEEEYMTAERKELLQKLQSDKEAITQAEKNLNEAQQKVSNLEKVESAIREKAQDMLTAPDRINDAESAQIKAGVDAQVAALQHKSTEQEYGLGSMEAGVTRSILNTSKDKYEAATANVNDLREKANYQPGQSANVFSATRQQTEAALKAGTGK